MYMYIVEVNYGDGWQFVALFSRADLAEEYCPKDGFHKVREVEVDPGL